MQGKGITIFASEQHTLEYNPKVNKHLKETCNAVEWLKADTGRLISLDDAACEKIDLTSLTPISSIEDCTVGKNIEEIRDWSADNPNLERCANCILPKTYPFIEFNDDGICNYCQEYVEPQLFGQKELQEELKIFLQSHLEKIAS